MSEQHPDPSSGRPDLDMAIAILDERGCALVIVRDGAVLGEGNGTGIRELLDLADRLGPAARGASLADRIIGRAAAMIARCMGLASVHAKLMSEGGLRILSDGGVAATWDRLVPAVLNRAGDGPCPMEAGVAGIEDPTEAKARLRGLLEGFSAPRQSPPRRQAGP